MGGSINGWMGIELKTWFKDEWFIGEWFTVDK